MSEFEKWHKLRFDHLPGQKYRLYDIEDVKDAHHAALDAAAKAYCNLCEKGYKREGLYHRDQALDREYPCSAWKIHLLKEQL